MPGATRTSSDSCHPCAINRYCTTSSYAQSTTDGVTQVQSECVDEETTYADFCFPFAANGLSSEAHIIGLEYNLDPSNVDVLHHFVLYGHYSSDCSDNGAANAGEHLGEWAPGVMDRVMPADVGVRACGRSPLHFFWWRLKSRLALWPLKVAPHLHAAPMAAAASEFG